jgi:hypothetical protein
MKFEKPLEGYRYVTAAMPNSHRCCNPSKGSSSSQFFTPYKIAALEYLKDMGLINIINQEPIVTLFVVMATKFVTDL